MIVFICLSVLVLSTQIRALNCLLVAPQVLALVLLLLATVHTGQRSQPVLIVVSEFAVAGSPCTGLDPFPIILVSSVIAKPIVASTFERAPSEPQSSTGFLFTQFLLK